MLHQPSVHRLGRQQSSCQQHGRVARCVSVHARGAEHASQPEIAKIMISAFASAVILATSAGPAYANVPSVIAGKPRVVDGDTLVIDSQRIRLYGVDAPESAQQCLDPQGKSYPCGLVSKDKLAALIGSSPVSCAVRNQDQYGRNVAVCSLAGLDLNKWLTENGYAVSYRQYSKDYIPAEDAAKAAKKGIWAGSFQVPSEWRKDNKRKEGTVGPSVAVAALPAAAVAKAVAAASPTGAIPVPACPDNAVPIKGNVSSSGEKIYHKSGGRYYDSVKIDQDGERYFCNEADAEKAGWRASKQ